MARTTNSEQLARIQKQIAELQKKQQALLAKSNTKVIAQIVALAKKNGISIDDIAGALKSTRQTASKVSRKMPSSARPKVAPKYRNPVDASQTWTGRGKAPLWAQAMKDAGTLDTAQIPSAT